MKNQTSIIDYFMTIKEDIRYNLRGNRGYMLDYFLRIKDKVNAEELRFY